MSLLREMWALVRTRRKYYLIPIFLVLALFGVLIILTQGSAIAPFIYAIF